ncbi:hypothetical protein CKO42_20130 [Lamprobacter modestohalophilus]|uniref:DNA primase/helicase Gp4 N-terminal Bacteriophage T7-like domain-containing protein n=1 Tax=Lamprobacter modestohalophilus TaxID=1064514 RepID=A0A9X0WC60_9GAMM|nr:toprim domain-containing protein [Lamprobacter modestohalophilus]MBK1620696.1 hypothetical protein [Lamprobacter modestohalophilus]
MRRLEVARVRAACQQASWCNVLNHLAGDLLAAALDRPGRHVACPIHGGVHGDGFRLFADVETTGGGICATCGAFPDGFALLQWLFGWSFPQTLERVAEVLRLDPDQGACALAWATPAISGQHRVTPPRRQGSSATLKRLWSQALAADHPDAGALQRYLAGRGLEGADFGPDALRLHPALPYWHRDAQRRPVLRGHFPAMLALVRAPSGAPISLHRTYLQTHGQGKAPVAAPRKLLPAIAGRSLRGSAVRLMPAGESLGIAEGLETALAASALSAMPVWACLSATLLARFVPPKGVRHLTLWVDKDRSGAGERAAAALRDRLTPQLAVTLRIPADPIPADMTSLDWADLWQSRAAGCAA